MTSFLKEHEMIIEDIKAIAKEAGEIMTTAERPKIMEKERK